MLKIRLSRIGKKKNPTYKIIVSESTRDTWGSNLEVLGSYDPFGKVCVVRKDRVLHWIANGAQCSPTIHNLFIDQNVIEGKKVVASKPGKKADGESKTGEASKASETSTIKTEQSSAPVEVKKEEAPAPTEEKKEDAPAPAVEKPAEEKKEA